MDTEQMIERARRITDDGVYPTPGVMEWEWAEALLAEHDARVAAERKAEAEARECEEESARRERLAYRLVAAERERDRVRAIVEEMGDGVSPECSGFADKLRRALGDQEAPTEPTCPECVRRAEMAAIRRVLSEAEVEAVRQYEPGPSTEMWAESVQTLREAARWRLPATPQEAPEPERCESCGEPADVRLDDGSTWCISCDGSARNLGYDDQPVKTWIDRPASLDAEPERCPTCGSDDRRHQFYGCMADPDPWHSALLVEGEQG